MTVPVEALEAAKLAVFNSQLGVDRYDGSPSDYDTDMRAALEAALPLLEDPIETGREAALAQWEARWFMLRGTIKRVVAGSISKDWLYGELGSIERVLPTGLPVGGRWIPRSTDRVTFQLEPERAKRLLEVLHSAGAHPSGLGSYEAANDALALREDLALMMEGQ